MLFDTFDSIPTDTLSELLEDMFLGDSNFLKVNLAALVFFLSILYFCNY